MTDSDRYEPSTYGERIAAIYDDLYGAARPAEATVEFLAKLAGKGPALELGIGTGRVAIPLAARGISVRGIDASVAMVEKMRAKPGGENLDVATGDFADVAVEGSFSLIYVVFTTLFGLLTQEEQVRCFANVAKRLDAGGAFVIEAFFPDLARFDRGQRVHLEDIDVNHVHLSLSQHDAVNQTITVQHLLVDDGGTRLYPARLRYAWPSELDLMASLAELRLEERWGGWKGESFTAQSNQHVSVYRHRTRRPSRLPA